MVEVWIWDEATGVLTAIRGSALGIADLLALAEGLFTDGAGPSTIVNRE
ncbi:MAG: hypothetical protein ACR2HN_11925 [Tepidiformaceae bacterium]